MERSEADDFARKCKGNYPRMTVEQVAAIRTLVLDFGRDVAGRALADFVANVSDYDAARLLAVIRRHAAESNPACRPVDAVQRTRQYLAGEWSHKYERARVDLLVHALDPKNKHDEAEADRLVAAVLPSLPVKTAELVKAKGWRSCMSACLAIVQQIDQEAGLLPVAPPDRKTLSAGA